MIRAFIVLTLARSRLSFSGRPAGGRPIAQSEEKEYTLPPVLSIVGKSESGKTTLIERLIPELKRRGYRVGIVKHAHHGFDMDREGKDSYRHKKAGADTVMIASPGRIAMVKDVPGESLDNLMSYFDDMDLLITEGFKSDHAPKIEIFRAERHQHPACLEDDTLMAMVSDTPLDVAIPQFATDDIQAIIEFIVDRFLPAR
jgi:molybdopterin-guanine dinucleotide biosynthesis adapter protein